MQPVMTRKRPVGVTVIAVLVALQGIILVALGIISLFLVVLPGWANAGYGGPSGARIAALILGIVLLALGGFSLFLAYGLWTLQRWAFLVTILVEGISIILSIVSIVTASGRTGIGGLIIPTIILLYFLLDTHVREAFQV